MIDAAKHMKIIILSVTTLTVATGGAKFLWTKGLLYKNEKLFANDYFKARLFSPACKLLLELYVLMLWCCDHCANNEFKRVSVSMHALVFFSLSLSVYVCVWVGGEGVATQTEATLISVLESNLACVQNGSLYQLGGSLPCLESGGSRSSSGDAFLMTALREQPDDRLLQRPTVCRGRTRKRLFMFYYYWSNSDPSYEWPLSIDIV